LRKESDCHEVVASPKVPLYACLKAGDAALLYFMARQNACEIWASMPSAELCFHKKALGFRISLALYFGYVYRI